MRFYIGGKEAFVTVDDWVPVTKRWIEKDDSSWVEEKRPVYAKSMN